MKQWWNWDKLGWKWQIEFKWTAFLQNLADLTLNGAGGGGGGGGGGQI